LNIIRDIAYSVTKLGAVLSWDYWTNL